MTADTIRSLTVLAPAKINLYLHVTGRRDDGYHLLDSLVAFADIGDKILIEAAQDFSLKITGPFAGSFTAQERDASPDSANLITRAVWALSRSAKKIPDVQITLTKNLPLASGLGGGSSDAAAALWGLMEYWSLPVSSPYLNGLMSQLGADLPSCFHCKPARMQGIGDKLSPAPEMPEMAVLLVNPGVPCRTAQIFQNFSGHYRADIDLPEIFEDPSSLADFLKDQDNDLTESALENVPVIADVLEGIERQEGCLLSRLCGSGASCFGLFSTAEDVMDAAENITRNHPTWWVRAGTLGRPERY